MGCGIDYPLLFAPYPSRRLVRRRKNGPLSRFPHSRERWRGSLRSSWSEVEKLPPSRCLAGFRAGGFRGHRGGFEVKCWASWQRATRGGVKRHCLTEMNREKCREWRILRVKPIDLQKEGKAHGAAVPTGCSGLHTDASRAVANWSAGRRGQSCGVIGPFARMPDSARSGDRFNEFDTPERSIRSTLTLGVPQSSIRTGGASSKRQGAWSVSGYWVMCKDSLRRLATTIESMIGVGHERAL